MSLRRPIRAAALAVAVSACAFTASAQNFPDHAIKIIVPTSPGGAIDVMRSGSAAETRQVLAADIGKWAKLVHDHHIAFDQP